MLKKGLPVTITMSSYPGEKFDGKIVVIDPFINDALRTARVRIDIDNPDFKLRPDMYVDAELAMDMGNALAVPVGAILRDDKNEPIVYVQAQPGSFSQRSVVTAGQQDGLIAISSGLKAGETVVSDGSLFLQFANTIK